MPSESHDGQHWRNDESEDREVRDALIVQASGH